MIARHVLVSMVAALGAAAAPSCEDVASQPPGARIALSVASLSYPGVTNASYVLEVRNKSGQVVFTRALDSRGYGPGDGAISYVGPCDGEPTENPNKVLLSLTGLYSGTAGATPIDPASYHNPGQLSRDVVCAENTDTAVTFDLTLARAANQGFFDVAIAFSDIFCSAKLDCVDASDQTLQLLHQPDGSRGRSVVLGLACTGDLAESGETYLYRAPVVVTCAAGTATVDPSAGPGNLTAGAGYTTTGTSPLFGAAVYQGEEHLSVNKRYWNVVLGLADTAASCTVTTRATASPDPFTGGLTPAGTTWPYIAWNRALTDAAGARACTTHPVDGAAPHDGVTTAYTPADDPETFAFAFGPGLGPVLCAPGQSQCAFASCKDLLTAGLATTDGLYAIDPDGPGVGDPAFTAFCDQTTDGGGWTLVRVSNGTATPDLRVETAVNVAGLADGPAANTNAQLASATVNALGNVLMVYNTAVAYDTHLWYDRLRACDAALTDLRWTYAPTLPHVAECGAASSVSPPSTNAWGVNVGTGTHINYLADHPLCFGSWLSSSKGHFCYNRNTLDWWNFGVDGDTSGNPNAHTALFVRAQPSPCTAGQTTCALASCQAILDAGLSTGSGTYAIDPDGPAAGAPAIAVWCAMPSATALRLGNEVNANWPAISGACPSGWQPYAIDRFERVAIAQAFAASQAPTWYWLNFFTGPGTAVTGPLENELGWLTGAGTGTWTASGFLDSGATALPNLNVSGNQNGGFYDPVPLAKTTGFTNRGAPTVLYNSSEGTYLGTVICTLADANPVVGALTPASPGRWADGSVAATCEGYRRPTLVTRSQAITDGVYEIDPDGADTGTPPLSAFCDMTTDEGGWTLLITYQTSATPFADPTSWPSAFATTGGPPDATGMYKGSLAAFSEIREQINSGSQTVWARNLNEQQLNLIRDLYGYTSRMSAAPSFSSVPACRKAYADATDNVTGCTPYAASANNGTVTGVQVDVHVASHCWFARGGGVWAVYAGSSRCASGLDPDGTRWARTWFR